MTFSNSQKESAVLGYIANQGFARIPASAIVEAEAFCDAQYRIPYLAALKIHRSGRAANTITINEEIQRLGLVGELDAALGGKDLWDIWAANCDNSLSFNPAGVADLMRDLSALAAKRSAVKIGQKLLEGKIDPAAAEENLRKLREKENAVSLESVLVPRRFDHTKVPEKARHIYEMQRKCICTPGNLTVIAALAKVGKSALVGAFVAGSLGQDGDTLGIDSANPHNHALIHFDTEQSPGDHHMLIATALFRCNRMDAPDWLRSYRIVDIPMAKRFDLLEHELRVSKKKHGGIHSVILDGVADYIADPNDPAEAFAAVERLHRLAVEFDTAIICVLHFNPGADSAKTRGHLGSQLERKAETNLALSKDSQGVTTVFTANARHAYISREEGPRFQWSEEKMMHVSVQSQGEQTKAESMDRLRMIVDEVFMNGDALRFSAARDSIAKVAKVSSKRAESLFSEMKNSGIIRRDLTGFWSQNK